MIASLRGTLVRKLPTEVLMEVHSIGYSVSIPLSTYEILGEAGSEIFLLTYLHVREDVLQLFGFASEEEREAFKMLISVSGIGPRMAQSILSGITVRDLRNHISRGNLGALTTIPGVGKKLAERLVVELRDKIAKLDSIILPVAGTSGETQARSEALLALTSLGYSRAAAEKALRAAIGEFSDKEATVEQLIKSALRHAGT